MFSVLLLSHVTAQSSGPITLPRPVSSLTCFAPGLFSVAAPSAKAQQSSPSSQAATGAVGSHLCTSLGSSIRGRKQSRIKCAVQMPELASPSSPLLIKYQSKQMVLVSPGVTKERAVIFQYFQTDFAFYSFFFLAFVSINIQFQPIR